MKKCGNYQIIDFCFLSFLQDIRKGQQPSKVLCIPVFSITRKSMNDIGHISDWLFVL
jgi:hypothetical protein